MGKTSNKSVEGELKNYDYFSVREHIEQKSMWLGTKNISSYEEWLYNATTEEFEKVSVEFSPALLKCFWELTCNAVDASIRSKMVKNIYLSFDKKKGTFSIFNDGGAIPVLYDDRVKEWLPQAVATNPFSGSNLKENKERRTGGTNGLGLKLCNIFSNKMTLESYDGKKGYGQIFEDRMKKINDPTIVKWSELDEKHKFKHVFIEFEPCWEAFTYKKKPNDEQLDVLERLVHTMAYQVAAYVNKTVTVKFNNEKIPIQSLDNYANLFCNEYVSTTLKHDTDPWDIILGIHEGGSLEHQSFVNGIYVRGGGDHMKAIENMVVDALKDKAQKILKDNNTTRFNRNMIVNHMFIFHRGNVPNPDFDGQRKDVLRAPPKTFKGYEIPATVINKFWKMLSDQILATYAQKELNKDSIKVNKKVPKIEGLRHADIVKTKGFSPDAYLMLSEGNSAESMVRRMLLGNTGLGFKNYGSYNLRGVPINARKEVRVVKNVMVRSAKWKRETNRLNNVILALGLDYTKSYKKDEDMKTLRYGGIIMMVDQDIDGVGNIQSLVLNAFDLFWPHLLKRGYIKQLVTPLIRVFPKGKKSKILEFFSNTAYLEWKNKEFGEGNEPEKNKFKIKYYKGLGTHETPEVKQIGKTFQDHLITFRGTEKSSAVFEAFFGKNANARKVELGKPMKDYAKYDDKDEIPCTIHLKRDTKEFQNEKNFRNLRCYTDGMNPSRRKILMGALDEFSGSNESIKVFQLGGAIAKGYQYHHGDMSLNGTITRMGQSFLGTNYFPILRGHGEFGSRVMGGNDAGSPRYIEVSLNTELVQLLFPKEERYILEYNFEDGQRSEPKEWPSIIPLTLVESFQGIGTGWKQGSWAHDVYDVIDNVQRLIKGKKLKSMKYESFGFKGVFREVKKIDHCLGMYEQTTVKIGRKEYDAVHITELPITVWSDPYLTWLQKTRDEYIYDIRDNCGDSIDIVVVLKDGAKEAIKNKFGTPDLTPFQDCFNLYMSMQSWLNLTDKDGIVHEFKSYEDVFMAWYSIRKDLYEMRLKRLEIMTKLRILYLKNIIEFSENYKKLNLPNKPEKEVLEILEGKKFTKFVKSPISEPKHVDYDMLKETYLGDKASYDYLVNLSTKNMYDVNVNARRSELKKYEELLEDIQDLDDMWLGAKWWLRELNELKNVIKEGRKTNWMFGHTTFNF